MIVFDTETTGLPKPEGVPLEQHPQIIEYAGIKLHDETLEEIGRFEFLANPGVKLPDIIVKITGITDELLAPAKSFGASFKVLAEFHLGERTWVAHHVGFDRYMMQLEMRRLGKMNFFPWPMEHKCTVEAATPIFGRKAKLGEVHKHFFGAEHDEAHRAMPDVEALVRCVRKLREGGMI